MRILIAIPTVRPVEIQFIQSLLPCIMGYSGSNKEITYGIFSPANYCIDASRNQIVEHAIKEKFDYIFWIDSDIIMPQNTLSKLFEADKDIVSAVYPYKIMPVESIVAKKYGEDGRYEDIDIDKLNSGLIKVDGIGFGCVLTKVDIFNKINKPYFVYTPDMGEDIYFSKKAQEVGFDIWLDTDIFCDHLGLVKFDIPKEVK